MARPTPPRPWKQIARELARETERSRIAELSHELNQALNEKEKKEHPEGNAGQWFSSEKKRDL